MDQAATDRLWYQWLPSHANLIKKTSRATAHNITGQQDPRSDLIHPVRRTLHSFSHVSEDHPARRVNESLKTFKNVERDHSRMRLPTLGEVEEMSHAWQFMLLAGLSSTFANFLLASDDICRFIPGSSLILSARSDGPIRQVAFCQEEATLHAAVTREGFPGSITQFEMVVFSNTVKTVTGTVTQHVSLQPEDALLGSDVINVFAINFHRNTVTVVRRIGSDENPVLEIDFRGDLKEDSDSESFGIKD